MTVLRTSVDESLLVKMLLAGNWADLTLQSGYDPENKPVLAAQVLRALVLGADSRAVSLPAGVRIRGLCLEGDLDLADCLGPQGGLGVLALEACDLPGRINVSNTELTRLSIRKSRFTELWGEGVQIKGDVDFRECSPLPLSGSSAADSAYIRLRAARIGGDVWGRGSQLRAPRDVPLGLTMLPDALNLSLATIGGSLALEGNPTLEDRFDCLGELNIIGAKIGGDVALRGARLSNPGDVVLSANDVEVGGDVLFSLMDHHRFEADGEVRLCNAIIRRDCDFRGARLANQGGDVLDASGCKIGGHLRLASAGEHRFTSEGRLALFNTTISGDFVCLGGRISNPGGVALGATSTSVGGSVVFNPDEEHTRCQIDGGLVLNRSTIKGNLDLDGTHISNPGALALGAVGIQIGGDALFNVISNHRFEADGEVRISNSNIASNCDFLGARLDNPEGDTLDASGCSIGGHLRLTTSADHRFESAGRILLLNAKVSGGLVFLGARLSRPGGVALSAEDIEIAGDAFFNTSDGFRFEAEGELRLCSGTVGGHCEFRGASISNSVGDAIDASGCRVAGHMRLMPEGEHRFESDGRLVLFNAEIGADLVCVGARLSNLGGAAFAANDVKIGGDALFHAVGELHFDSKGQVLLANAQISGMLLFEGGRLSCPDGIALDLEAATVEGALRAHDNEIEGNVALAVTRIDVLGSFAPSAWRGADRISLDEISIRQILVDPDDGVPWKQRRDWLRRNSFRDKRMRLIVSPHPWREFASAFARSGRHLDARRLQREGYREENRARPKWQQPFVWLFAEIPFGFGLSIVRTTATVLGFWCVGTLGAEAMYARGVLVNTQQASTPCRSVVPSLYALDTAIPFLDLRQESRCDPDRIGQKGLYSGVTFTVSLPLITETKAVPPTILQLFDEVTLWQWAKTIYALVGSLVVGFAAVTYSGVFKPKE